MYLSCSYNFFNGEEHLINSLKFIRNTVDYITIIYQNISNRGEKISDEGIYAINYAMENNLVDYVYDYTPNFGLTPQENERIKRNIGLSLAIEKNVHIFFSMDADEFYYEKEMIFAKNYIERRKLIGTYCHSYMHLKSPRYRSLDTTNVCFIHRINSRSKIGNFPSCIHNVDPTRIIKTKVFSFVNLFYKSYYMFLPSEISMYHMNFVRKDNLKSKLSNTSTTDKEFINSLKKNIDSWTPGEKFFFPGKGIFYFDKVNNDFKTYDNESI